MSEIDMTTSAPPPAAGAPRSETDPQLLARLTGLLFIITYLTAIPPVVSFYRPVLDDPRYVLGAGADPGIAWGALFELALIAANIGTAVALFPILRRRYEALMLGYVTARLVESGFIAVGILSLLAVATLRQQAAGLDPDALVATGRSLVAVHNWTFLLGPGFVVGAGNGLLLGYLMWRSRLVPRPMAVLGLIGGPLILISGTAVLFGAIGAGSVWQLVATIPEFFWELALGIWLLVKGANPAALAALEGGAAATR
jgi:hypothetical protein